MNRKPPKLHDLFFERPLPSRKSESLFFRQEWKSVDESKESSIFPPNLSGQFATDRGFEFQNS